MLSRSRSGDWEVIAWNQGIVWVGLIDRQAEERPEERYNVHSHTQFDLGKDLDET